jgi:hypothetical protein
MWSRPCSTAPDAVEAVPRIPADQVGAYERDLDRQIVDTFAAIHELTAGLSEPARHQLHHHLGRLEDRTADQAEARGYQQAIANLLDTAGYKRWHKQVYATTGVDHHRWNFNNRVTLADYLEAVAPGQPGAPDGATP